MWAFELGILYNLNQAVVADESITFHARKYSQTTSNIFVVTHDAFGF
jgi:hypothetical protein